MSLNDQHVLAGDLGLRGRIGTALAATCVYITLEASTAAYHYERAKLATQILGQLDSQRWPVLFQQVVCTDSQVVDDATEGGTVELDADNVAEQAAKVTDAHLSAAVSSQFNSFIYPA